MVTTPVASVDSLVLVTDRDLVRHVVWVRVAYAMRADSLDHHLVRPESSRPEFHVVIRRSVDRTRSSSAIICAMHAPNQKPAVVRPDAEPGVVVAIYIRRSSQKRLDAILQRDVFVPGVIY
jgi:hypothetical protein